MKSQDLLRIVTLAGLSERQRVLAAAAGAVVLLGVLFGVALPRHREAVRLRAEEAKIQSDLVGLQARLDDARRRLTLAAGQGLPQFEELTRVSAVLDELMRIGRAHQLELIAVRPEAQGAGILSIRLEVRARFRDLVEYLAALEALPRPLRVMDLKMETNEGVAPLVAAAIRVDAALGAP